ncbi:hypothetical protein ABPG72_011976 [Tetrahymena utriculariae]
MSVCLNFLKGYLVLGCIFNIGLGIGAFVAAAYLNNLNQSFLVNGGVSAGKKYGVIGLFALGGVCCLIGLLGILAFWKKIKCFQFLFILFNTLFLIIFAAVLAALIYSQPFLNNLKNQNCQDISELQEAESLFSQKLYPAFCKYTTTTVCPCYVTDKSKWSSVDTSKIVFQLLPSSNDVKAVTECQYVSSYINGSQTEIDLLKAVEEQFNCTGICTTDVVYYFSDINRGPPSSSDGCFKPLKDLLLKIIGGVFIFVVISTVFSFLNVLFGFVNCCCAKYDNPQNQNQKQNPQNQQDLNSFEMSSRKPLNPSIQCNQYEDSLFINGLNHFKSNGWIIYISLFFVCFFFGLIGLIYAFTFAKCKWLAIITITFNLVLIGYFSTLIAAKTLTSSSISTHIGKSLNDCMNMPFFAQCQYLYTKSLAYWCQHSCPCAIKDPTIWEPFFWNNYVSNTGSPVNKFQECGAFETSYKLISGLSDSEFTYYTNFLIAVESQFQCSQMCSVAQIFTFSDVSNGKPNQDQPCYQQYLDFINSFVGSFNLIGVFGTSLSTVQLFLQLMHLFSKKKNRVTVQNNKAVSLPKSNHDESYIKNKAQKNVL